MKRFLKYFILGCLLAALPLTVSFGAPVTFNSAATSTGMTLSNGNLTATASNFITSSTLSTTSYNATGSVCFEAQANTIGQTWTLGIANASFNLANPGGVGIDNNAIGIDNNSGGSPQGIFLNNLRLSVGVTNSASNEIDTICVNFATKRLWVTNVVMRAASGATAWNNDVVANQNPATATGGLLFTALTCPCFIIFNEAEVGVATLNAAGPFAVATPSGFSPWQPAAAPTGHPVMVIMGRNDKRPHPRKGDLRYALFEQRRRSA
jgi:hypothetical protein